MTERKLGAVLAATSAIALPLVSVMTTAKCVGGSHADTWSDTNEACLIGVPAAAVHNMHIVSQLVFRMQALVKATSSGTWAER